MKSFVIIVMKLQLGIKWGTNFLKSIILSMIGQKQEHCILVQQVKIKV